MPLYFWGAHTGRLSGWDKVNVQNFKKKSEVRYSILAPKGYLLVAADSSQIEARDLAWLAGEESLLEQFRNGLDVYSIFGTNSLFKSEVRKPKSTDSPEVYTMLETRRFISKTCVLGLGYGMGAAKLAASILTQSNTFIGRKIVLQEYEAESYKQIYRNTFPSIPALWKKCQSALFAMISKHDFDIGKGVIASKDGVVRLPGGIVIAYPDLRLDNNEIIYTTKKGRSSETKRIYGAKLVENICQALAAEIIRFQWNLIALKYKVVGQVHDELLVLIPEDDKENAVLYIQDCMSRAPDWASDLPLACEVGVGKNYGECK